MAKTETIRVRVTPAEKAAFVKAAVKDGRDLSGWLRMVVRAAAGMVTP